MNVTATYKGQSVTIVDVTRNGSSIYITYIDSSNDMFVDNITSPDVNVQIASGATVN